MQEDLRFIENKEKKELTPLAEPLIIYGKDKVKYQITRYLDKDKQQFFLIEVLCRKALPSVWNVIQVSPINKYAQYIGNFCFNKMTKAEEDKVLVLINTRKILINFTTFDQYLFWIDMIRSSKSVSNFLNDVGVYCYELLIDSAIQNAIDSNNDDLELIRL